jgi:hypothetical protein
MLVRLISYSIFFCLYIYFMHTHAPLGIEWLDWHYQRLSNFIGFLNHNGYVNTLGYSIWSKCTDCNLSIENWTNNLYLSAHSLIFFPYFLIEYFFGNDGLNFLGQSLDKLIIFLCGLMLSEMMVKSLRGKTLMPDILVGLATFALFITSPWTYKMMLAGWTEIYVALFFLAGINFFRLGHSFLGYVCFAFVSLFNLTWGIALFLFYLIYIISERSINYNSSLRKSIFPIDIININSKLKLFLALLLPAVLMLIFRSYASSLFESTSGSSALFRMGISGNDIHNGGILGALQFLGGNRISVCIDQAAVMQSLTFSGITNSIIAFNCVLSIGSMTMVSILAIAFLLICIRKNSYLWAFLCPLGFALMLLAAIFQQSFSVHLMGYSFIFAIFFASGLVLGLNFFASKISNPILAVIFLSPIIIAIISLSLRISMTTVVNG